MNIAGYLAAVLIGVSLGLIGGGGSILTLPVLVYLLGIDAVAATTYSLFVVGLSSATGALAYSRKKLVDLKMAFSFGMPSLAAVWVTRNYILPAIPQQVCRVSGWVLDKDTLLMLFFALVMIGAAYSMIRKRPPVAAPGPGKINYALVLMQGGLVGVVTGLIGAGGGFLVIPALVNWLKMPMKRAVGTSLLIITINSLAGFMFSMRSAQLQWPLLATVSGLAILGILMGTFLAAKIDGNRLKPAFGWFVLVMGTYILLREILLH
ncbi:sulfite exporter TauE/SafE family protein [Taibaiella chishuiensis]|uniref:Probable membrane transporter protein n=1 Tax=Taibaiella chishuiensis TaxID=1434707 RepID=A0A2P8D7F7_9BACT|nr:sulfite exporter TauE/SafE family protein [Taibaiella chishuiensis]PSK93160.1 hypothetical protein B0I18_102130 [Taibaiella chishuiensis]